MNKFGFVALICAAALSTSPPPAKADQWNQKTLFTFNEPVEIPGQVLSAGTYVFRLAGSEADRDIVQIFNKDETHLYATILAVPDERLAARGKPIMTFEERAANSPEAIRAWFYPGDNYGHAFVYPKTKAVALAKANRQPVASMPDELAGNTMKPAKTMNESSVTEMKQAKLTAQKSNGEETTLASEFPRKTNNTASK